MKILITGSSGLVGSESVRFYADKGYDVYGIDNNMRKYFFGKEADTFPVQNYLVRKYNNFKHFSVDVRDNKEIQNIFIKYGPFDIIIHAAAQPSHDWAAKEPMTDFTINANGTHVMLENTRVHSPNAVFIQISTNKVYGDTPNTLSLVEKKTRYELPENHVYYKGIDESMTLDNSKHSLMGASKLAADIMAQEYARYFGLKVGVFRCGCITGPGHAGAQLHGFLSYLVKCIVQDKKYFVFGYKGKQVRDNIHSYDLVNAFHHFAMNPKPGEVYNIGGSRHSNISILEAIQKIENLTGKKANFEIQNKARKGDHKWYISDVRKFQDHYPDWRYKYNIDDILKDLVKAHKK